MKVSKKYCVLFLILCSSACVKKTDYTPPDVSVKYDDLLKSLKSGGQPGEISLNGVGVMPDGSTDSKISIEQAVGSSSEKTEISPKILPKLTADIKRKSDYKPSQFNTYLNVGCNLQDDPRVEGMTESKNKPNESGIADIFGSAASMVDKVFICGKVDIKENFVTINVNEVFLEDAEISMTNSLGSISISSDVLSISGHNIIFTSGVSGSTASLLSAPPIKLSTFERILETGSLKLKSVGGDYISQDKN